MIFMSQLCSDYQGHYLVGRHEYILGDGELLRVDSSNDTLTVSWDDQWASITSSDKQNGLYPVFRTIRDSVLLEFTGSDPGKSELTVIDSIFSHYSAAFDSLYALSISSVRNKFFVRYSTYSLKNDSTVIVNDYYPLRPSKFTTHTIRRKKQGFLLISENEKREQLCEARFDLQGRLRYSRRDLLGQEYIAEYQYLDDRLEMIRHDLGEIKITIYFDYSANGLKIRKKQ